MNIKSRTTMLLFRFGRGLTPSNLNEHKQLIAQNGYVWLMKTGKNPRPEKIKSALDCGGFIIIRESKHFGGIYYLAHCVCVKCGAIKDFDSIPEYYKKRLITNATWYKLDLICDLDEEYVKGLIIQSNAHKVVEYIDKTSSSFMIIQNEESMIY